MLIQGSPAFLNNDDICTLIKLASERKLFDVALELVKLYDLYKNETEGLNMLREKLKTPKLEKYNLLGRLIFIICDELVDLGMVFCINLISLY